MFAKIVKYTIGICADTHRKFYVYAHAWNLRVIVKYI